MTSYTPMLIEHVSDAATLRARYHLLSLEGALPRPLGFQIVLPKNWRGEILDRVGPLPNSPFTALVRFVDPAGPEHAFVFAAHLPREVNPSDWLRLHVRNRELTVLDWRELPSRFGWMADAFAVGSGPTAGMGHRLVTLKDANRLFLLDFRMSSADAVAQERALVALEGFRLTSPAGEAHAEPFRETILDGRISVIMQVSTLWHESGFNLPHPPGTALRVFDNRLGAQSMGTMLAILGAPGHQPETLEEVALGRFEANGITLARPGEAIASMGREDGSARARVRKHAARNGDIELTLLSAVVEIGRAPLSLTLLSPSVEAELESWGVNRRAFEIALASVRPA